MLAACCKILAGLVVVVRGAQWRPRQPAQRRAAWAPLRLFFGEGALMNQARFEGEYIMACEENKGISGNENIITTHKVGLCILCSCYIKTILYTLLGY